MSETYQTAQKAAPQARLTRNSLAKTTDDPAENKPKKGLSNLLAQEQDSICTE